MSVSKDRILGVSAQTPRSARGCPSATESPLDHIHTAPVGRSVFSLDLRHDQPPSTARLLVPTLLAPIGKLPVPDVHLVFGFARCDEVDLGFFLAFVVFFVGDPDEADTERTNRQMDHPPLEHTGLGPSTDELHRQIIEGHVEQIPRVLEVDRTLVTTIAEGGFLGERNRRWFPGGKKVPGVLWRCTEDWLRP